VIHPVRVDSELQFENKNLFTLQENNILHIQSGLHRNKQNNRNSWKALLLQEYSDSVFDSLTTPYYDISDVSSRTGIVMKSVKVAGMFLVAWTLIPVQQRKTNHAQLQHQASEKW